MIFKKLFKKTIQSSPKNESGIALFLVLSTVMTLSIVVTEFTYVAQVNARLAFDSSDQLKAHYLALTGLKISLLRLKAFQTLKGFGGNGGGSTGTPSLPRPLLEQVWKFPFSYPIPASLPGLSVIAKDEISKFQKESALEGRFSTMIESDSNRMNLNSILPAYAAAVPTPTPTASPSPTPTATNAPKYDSKEAREGLKQFITNVIDQKFKDDQDFASEYRDLNLEELMDNIIGWVDPKYQPKNASGKQIVPYKKAPFYSVSELRMIYPIDDALYQLLSPQFTTAPTTGVNVNTLEAPLLKAFFPNMTKEESDAFFKFRDSTEADNTFKDEKAFWDYLSKNVPSVGSKSEEIRQKFQTQGVNFIVDEETFKITVTAEVNKAMRVIEAWVTLSNDKLSKDSSKKKTNTGTGGTDDSTNESDKKQKNDQNSNSSDSTPKNNSTPNIGLKITFMRES